MFLTDVQADLSGFSCQMLHCTEIFLKFKLDYHQFLSFIGYPLIAVFSLESFIKQPFGLGFSTVQKTCFIIKTLCMYILPHFDVDFQIPLMIKYNQLGSLCYPFDCRSITLIPP